MLKLTKTGIGLLTKQYRSVLRKCLLLNLTLLTSLVYKPSNAVGDSSLSLDMNPGSYTIGNGFSIRDLAGYKCGQFYVNESDGGNFLLWGKNTRYLMNLYATSSYETAIELYNGSGRTVLLHSDSNGGYLDIGSSRLTGASFKLNGSSYATGIDFATNVTAGTTDASHLATTGAVNQLLNYYYTFRVDKRTEVIEFAKELRSNKKEMSSLDFMPIKSSNDLQINLIKAEDPLTFSVKTRDDSLVLMEVCHA